VSVTISTPSRLHFGLLRFEQAEGPSFGGLGMMIAEPRCVVRLITSNEWRASGPDANRAVAFAKQSLDFIATQGAAGQRPAGAARKTNHQGTKDTKTHQGRVRKEMVREWWLHRLVGRSSPSWHSFVFLGDLCAFVVNLLNPPERQKIRSSRQPAK
jgi:hypothetical protein